MNNPRVWRIAAWLFIAVVAFFVFLTLAWFVFPGSVSVDDVEQADAVVVFAGRPERLDVAVEMMEREVAPSLVIPKGSENSVDAEGLCAGAEFTVYCPETDDDNTWGEARAISRLAGDQGWDSLVVVTSSYHVRRATFLLGRCYEGTMQVVIPSNEPQADLSDKIVHEWAGLIGGFFLDRDC